MTGSFGWNFAEGESRMPLPEDAGAKFGGRIPMNTGFAKITNFLNCKISD